MAAEAENAAAPGGAAVGASLYVVGIDASVTDSELHALFSRFGEVVSVEVCEDLSIGLSLRYGYVHYRNPQCAQRALEELNFTPLNGKPIRIMSFHQEPGTSKSDAETLYIKNSENKIDHKALPENFLSEDEAKFTNVFVKNLCESTTMDDLKNIFGEFGKITSAAVMTNDDGTSKCFGFVNFQTAEDAARAVESLDGQIFGNRKWYVGRAQNKHERHLRLKHDLGCVKYAFDNGCNLFVKNLDPSIDEKELKELFSEFGSVTSCRVLRDEKGNSKEKGCIAFSSAKEASDALSGMNGKDHFDKILHVVIAQRKEERRAPLQNSGKEIDHNALPEPEMFSSSEGIHSCKVATHASGHSKGYDFVQFAGEATGQEAIGELYSIIRELTVVISKLNSDIGKLNGTVGELNGNVMKLDGLLLNRKQVNTENALTKEIELIVDRANLTDVFVKLSELTTDEDLRKIFDEFGLVTDAMVMRNADGTSKCFGFVSFKNAKDAARAVESLNGQRFDKTKWFSGRAQKKLGSELEQKNSFEQPVKEAINVEEAVDKQCNLFVKNLDFSIDDEKLMELFSSFGLVTSYKIFMERKGKKSSAYGFVSFSSPEEASRALSELNGKIISGKPLHVALAQKKEDRIAQLQNSDKENGHKALPEASVSSVDKEVDKGTNQHVGKPDHNTPRGRLSEMFSPVTSLKSSKNSDKENDHKALPEASVSSVDKEVNKGTNQHVGKPDRSTPRGRLSEVFSPVTSVKPSEAMRDQNSTNRGSGFNALSPSEQDAKSLSEKNAKSFSSKHLHVAQAQRKEDRRTWSQGHPRRLMHSMSVTLTHYQQWNSLSAKDFPMQKDLQPALGTKQQIIPRGHDYDCPLGGGFSVQYETGRLSLYDVVKSHSIHIGALASSLANASSLNRGGRCWMRYCSHIASRCRLNS